MDRAFASFFDTKHEYERNNRSDGCKALRCFPDCKHGGHQTHGFCGRTASVAIHLSSEKDEEYWMNNVLAVAQFRPLDVDGLSSRDSISKDELLSSMRTTLHPKEEYILGEVTVSTARIKENKTLRICFNRECMAWHYGWRSSKWIQDNPHVMDVVLLEDRKDSHMGVIASFLSNEFVITSTKKKRNDVKEEAKKCVDHTKKGKDSANGAEGGDSSVLNTYSKSADFTITKGEGSCGIIKHSSQSEGGVQLPLRRQINSGRSAAVMRPPTDRSLDDPPMKKVKTELYFPGSPRLRSNYDSRRKNTDVGHCGGTTATEVFQV